MRRKLLVLSVFTMIAGGTTFAQQDKLITHFMFDKMSLNPGKTGIDGGICATTMYRNQWDKVNGAPNSAVLNVEADLRRWVPMGVGISFFHDHIGFNTQNNVLLNLNYMLDIGSIGTLSAGVGVGIVNFGMSPIWVPPTTINDASLPTGYTATNLDLNFGLYLKGQNFYAGLSSTHLTQSALNGPSSTNPATQVSYNTARHYYVMGGYTFRDLGPGDLETNLLLRTEFVKFSADVNARYTWNDMLYGGLSYRLSDAVAVMVGYHPVQNLTIGYAYDISTNRLSGISKGTHEIMLKYCYFLPPVPIAKSKHPRWL